MINNYLPNKKIRLINRQASIKMQLVSDDQMALSEHIEEFSQRLGFCLIVLFTMSILCFVDVKEIVKLFQAPAIGVKFLQFAPGEYFFASVKIAFFCLKTAAVSDTKLSTFKYLKPNQMLNNTKKRSS